MAGPNMTYIIGYPTLLYRCCVVLKKFISLISYILINSMVIILIILIIVNVELIIRPINLVD